MANIAFPKPPGNAPRIPYPWEQQDDTGAVQTFNPNEGGAFPKPPVSPDSPGPYPKLPMTPQGPGPYPQSPQAPQAPGPYPQAVSGAPNSPGPFPQVPTAPQGPGPYPSLTPTIQGDTSVHENGLPNLTDAAWSTANLPVSLTQGSRIGGDAPGFSPSGPGPVPQSPGAPQAPGPFPQAVSAPNGPGPFPQQPGAPAGPGPIPHGAGSVPYGGGSGSGGGMRGFARMQAEGLPDSAGVGGAPGQRAADRPVDDNNQPVGDGGNNGNDSNDGIGDIPGPGGDWGGLGNEMGQNQYNNSGAPVPTNRTDSNQITAWLQWLAGQPNTDPILKTPNGIAYYLQRIMEKGGLGSDNVDWWQNKATLSQFGGGVGAPGEEGGGAGAGGGSNGGGAGGGADYQSGPVWDAVMRLLARGEHPVTADDPNIKNATNAFRTQTEGALRNSRMQMAERAAAEGMNSGGEGSGAFDSALQSASEQEGRDVGSYSAQAVMTEIQARRQDVVNALQFAQGAQRMQLQQYLSMLNEQLSRAQMAQQNNQFYDQYGFNVANANRNYDLDYAKYLHGL